MLFTVAALYKFVALPDLHALRQPLRELCARLEIIGTVLLAPEGINGTVAGSSQAIDAFLHELREGGMFGGRLADLDAKLSTAQTTPFKRLKIRLRREIVTLGDPAADPATRTGTYVAAADWNALIARDDVIVVDVRNKFEVAMGSFEGAVDPGTRSFSDFKIFAAEALGPARSKTVAMYCTGGIRCEKASAHLLAQGFSDVRQLRGGILKYLEETDPADSRWRGGCFVFDERVALGHGLAQRTPEIADA